MDTGVLLLRVMIAAILSVHAVQKLFGWFSGPGLKKSLLIFEELGQRPGRRMVLVAGAAELAGAALLLLGLATPLGAAIVTGTMVVAGLSLTVTKGTPWNALGGGEYPLVLALVAAGLAFTGPGAWSLDALLDAPWVGIEESSALVLGATTILVAVLAALVPVRRARVASAKVIDNTGKG